MSASLDALIPELQEFARELVDLAGRAGVQPRVTSTLRSHAQQQRLYNAYLRGESHYPVAPPGHSAHEYGYAFDMIADTQENLHDLGTVWREWGGVWSPHDEVHFEFPGFSVAALQASESASGPVAGGAWYKLADFLSGFVPWLGEAQLADTLYTILRGDSSSADFYLQHPAEAIRDFPRLLGPLFSSM